jgi:hypothetical protein
LSSSRKAWSAKASVPAGVPANKAIRMLAIVWAAISNGAAWTIIMNAKVAHDVCMHPTCYLLNIVTSFQ